MTNPIHRCKIHCHTIDPNKMDVLGIEEDKGKWMSFAFHIGTVVGCKLSTDEEDLLPFGCTTIFTEQGDTYIIDTPYEEFEEKFIQYHENEEAGSRNKEASL
jgi:hypothetical protein